jgi:hypothetical protein
MRQLGIAMFTSQDAYGTKPPFQNTGKYPLAIGNNQWLFRATFYFDLLPFIDQQNLVMLWINGGANDIWYSTNGSTLYRTPPPRIFLCPSDPSGIDHDGTNPNDGPHAVTNYVLNGQVWYPGGVSQNPKVPSSFPDGAATTVLMYERYGSCGPVPGATLYPQKGRFTPIPWYPGGWHDPHSPLAYTAYPGNGSDWGPWTPGTNNPFPVFQSNPGVTACDPSNTQGMHNGQNALLGDCSVRPISPSVSETSWSAAVTPSGLAAC